MTDSVSRVRKRRMNDRRLRVLKLRFFGLRNAVFPVFLRIRPEKRPKIDSVFGQNLKKLWFFEGKKAQRQNLRVRLTNKKALGINPGPCKT